MYVRRKLLLVYFLAMFIAATMARSYQSDKRVQNPTSFKTMMRYGRADKDNKIIHSRADAFFLGPRYGKRSSSFSPTTSLVYPVSATTPICVLDQDLSCTYTGVSDLYRCALRKEQTNGFSTSTN